MERFAALMDNDDNLNKDENKDSFTPLDRLSPNYSTKNILEIYSNSPKGLNHLSDEVKKSDRIFLKEIQTPVCESFQPPASEINSTVFLSTKTVVKPPQGHQTKNIQTKQKKNDQKKKKCCKEVLWFYKDPLGRIVGPYNSPMMRKWYEHRYFDKSLLIKQANVEGIFRTISSVFNDLSTAFLDDEKRLKLLNEENNYECGREENNDSLFAFSLSKEEENEVSELLKLK